MGIIKRILGAPAEIAGLASKITSLERRAEHAEEELRVVRAANGRLRDELSGYATIQYVDASDSGLRDDLGRLMGDQVRIAAEVGRATATQQTTLQEAVSGINASMRGIDERIAEAATAAADAAVERKLRIAPLTIPAEPVDLDAVDALARRSSNVANDAYRALLGRVLIQAAERGYGMIDLKDDMGRPFFWDPDLLPIMTSAGWRADDSQQGIIARDELLGLAVQHRTIAPRGTVRISNKPMEKDQQGAYARMPDRSGKAGIGYTTSDRMSNSLEYGGPPTMSGVAYTWLGDLLDSADTGDEYSVLKNNAVRAMASRFNREDLGAVVAIGRDRNHDGMVKGIAVWSVIGRDDSVYTRMLRDDLPLVLQAYAFGAFKRSVEEARLMEAHPEVRESYSNPSTYHSVVDLLVRGAVDLTTSFGLDRQGSPFVVEVERILGQGDAVSVRMAGYLAPRLEQPLHEAPIKAE